MITKEQALKIFWEIAWQRKRDGIIPGTPYVHPIGHESDEYFQARVGSKECTHGQEEWLSPPGTPTPMVNKKTGEVLEQWIGLSPCWEVCTEAPEVRYY
ncbi:hypothetical protein L1O03_06220 [Corynebacterium uropygiale]|uniref:Uncharacterized protein n=1 Tax=Corynebacterium uropygiale TaxID=1775911 RepID=A0A9X1QP58_9CORY|nr:hypothetical protein [Corynebacterium uropygiale]MCF4006774.1 hypothetical protein [Corynebacterium uropygiale]